MVFEDVCTIHKIVDGLNNEFNRAYESFSSSYNKDRLEIELNRLKQIVI